MSAMPRQTTMLKKTDVKPRWYHVDADGKVLGRLATEIATVLMGKHRPQYTPHVDTGDYVIVTNASKIVLTGRKLQHKEMANYVYYPGGRKTKTYEAVKQKHPERLIEHAVTRMLPKNRLGKQMARKLRVYAGAEHPHLPQNAEALARV
jgi:large subunit ribosomal protein L13